MRNLPETSSEFRFDDLPDAAHVRLPVVATLYATSPSNVWRWVKQGLIPAPRKLGPQTTVWNVGDLRKALATGGQSTRP
ncbi:AlpA family transcriptional regulator [Brevundimonas sp.]|uniref:helix-turn-helix transcriptional regulator n=1 Tax=Brevundimonas sp. TaxID=1871086 RepID=UPI0024877415|nr:AlpA family phage regulatory protein [Brevundimonas sp.]MDI1282267.1 AlpA family phage regulatory protein [Brevundimonas sp.]